MSGFILVHIGCLIIAWNTLLLLYVVAVAAVQFSGLLRAVADFLRFVPPMLPGRHIQLLLPRVDLVILDDRADDFTHVVLLLHASEQSIDPVQLRVRRIVIPAHRRHGIFRLE